MSSIQALHQRSVGINILFTGLRIAMLDTFNRAKESIIEDSEPF